MEKGETPLTPQEAASPFLTTPLDSPEWAGENAERRHLFCRVRRVSHFTPRMGRRGCKKMASLLSGQKGCPRLISGMGRRECRGTGSPSAGVQRRCPRLVSRMGRTVQRDGRSLCRGSKGMSRAYLPNGQERVQRGGQSLCRGSKGVPTFSSLSFSRPKGALNPLGFGLP